MNLIIGAGFTPATDGWVRTEYNLPLTWRELLQISGRERLHLDLNEKFPLVDGSCRRILCEHVIEHVSQASATRALAEFRRVLAPKGRLRLVTPDLERLFAGTIAPSPLLDAYLAVFPAPQGLTARSHVINHEFRSYGHQYIYDIDSLVALARNAGFSQVEVCRIDQGHDPELIAVQQRNHDPLNLLCAFALECVA